MNYANESDAVFPVSEPLPPLTAPFFDCLERAISVARQSWLGEMTDDEIVKIQAEFPKQLFALPEHERNLAIEVLSPIYTRYTRGELPLSNAVN